MSLITKVENIHAEIRQNRWHWLFQIFCRFSLALGFIIARITKVIGERFASGLSELHPMGSYLTALHETGYYYTFIGIAQIVAGILLIIPRTVLLGVLIYFPIILNICILSFAVRFDGSFVTAPLMVLANMYLLFWHYDRIKFVLPIKSASYELIEKPLKYSLKFPWMFAVGVLSTIGIVILFFVYGHEVMPRNSKSDCIKQFLNTKNEQLGTQFCECIHTQGNPLDSCLSEFKKGEN